MGLFKKYFINLKAFLRNRLPLPAVLIIERVRVLPLFIKWKRDNHNGFSNFLKNTKNLKGRFSGKRCVIIGNGPSLNKTDLSLLKNEYTFGLNRIYLLFNKLGFHTDFLVSINRYVIEQFADEMLETNCTKFFNYKFKNHIKNKNSVSFISPSIYSPEHFNDIEKGYLSYNGSVTFSAIQLAIYFGFNEIILVGFDNNFKNSGQSDKAIKSKNIDEDHFDKNYFSKGVVWQLPNYKALDYNFNFVNDYFNRENDLNIINCTVGGNLNMFKRNDLKKQLSESKYQNKT